MELEQKVYEGEWIEDDGVSAEPNTYTVKIRYWIDVVELREVVRVEARAFMTRDGFRPLWRGKLFVLLPDGDQRGVAGANQGLYPTRSRWMGVQGEESVMGQFVVPDEVYEN